jgi:lipopolysaccharide transport system permease protein
MASHGFELRGERSDLRTLAADLWRCRDLVRVLARKDFYVQYRRASFGIIWAFALPLVQASVLAAVIPRVADFDVDGSYVVFVFAGTTSWAFFSSTLTAGAGSIVDASDLSTKIYFPRIVLPAATVVTGVYGLVPGVLLLAVMATVDEGPQPELLLLGPAVVVAVCLASAFACLAAALQVYFRDVRYLLTAAMIAWFYVTPVFYPLAQIGGLRRWIEINPMTGVVELFRAATVGADRDWAAPLLWTAAWTVVVGGAALLVHRRYDRVFVDLL